MTKSTSCSLNDILERTRKQLAIRDEQSDVTAKSTTVVTSAPPPPTTKPSKTIFISNELPNRIHQELPLAKEMTQSLAQEMGIPEPNDNDDNYDDIAQQEKACLLDTVMERTPTIPTTASTTSTKARHDCIDGYTPKTNTEATSMPKNTNSQPAEMAMEMDMNFTCMTPQEYKDTCQLAQSMGMTMKDFMESITDQQQPNKQEEEETPIPKEEDEPLPPGVQFYHSNEEEEEDHDIFDFWCNNDEEEEDEEEEEPERPLRTFMIFWNALMEWMTPAAMNVLFEYQEELVELYDTSDVGASRCAGLLTMLKMNMSRSYKELSMVESSFISKKLTQWIRSFDFSRPMVKFSMPQWKALTTILLQIILFHPPPNNKNNFPTKEVQVPPSVQAVDITREEYIYLTQSAMASLRKGSA